MSNQCCAAFLPDFAALALFSSCQDVRCATLLSELVYRAAESADEADFRQAQVKVEQEVGATLSHVRCHKSGGQRYAAAHHTISPNGELDQL